MKLSDHVEHIRLLALKAFDNQFSRLGVGATRMMEIEKIPSELHSKRKKIEVLINSHKEEVGGFVEAREKALDELTFTLFNRIASIKVMEAHQLFPPIVTKESEHGDRSFGHKMWLEQNPEMRNEELEGIREYFKFEFNKLGESIPLFHRKYPYALLPYVIELNEIIDAFNAVEKDNQIDDNIWQSDDILGWLYESYNNSKKQAHKESGDKTEYNKVSLQSQVYTPRWVVEFLVHNSLGKMYLEMYPDSKIKNQFKIANAPKTRTRERKPLHEIKLIDPASGSGNFLLYAFEFFYKLYQDQIDNYDADYDEDEVPQLIIEKNLHGVDLDDRAIQLAQLGLWIKAKKLNRNTGKLQFNVVSSDFVLPDFEFVYPIFKQSKLDSAQLRVVEDIWSDLQQAYKFGSLVRIEEKINIRLGQQVDASKDELFKDNTLFEDQFEADLIQFKKEFIDNCQEAFERYATHSGSAFVTDKTKDAITFLRLITQRYDVATANPPFTDRSNFGPELKVFIETNYKKPYKFHTNLYSSFIKRCFELTNEQGKIAMIHPLTFMFLQTFEDVRSYILDKSKINLLVYHGPDTANIFDGAFASAPAYYVLEKHSQDNKGLYVLVEQYTRTELEKNKKQFVLDALSDSILKKENKHNFYIDQKCFNDIKSKPFIFWISDSFREKFGNDALEGKLRIAQGLATSNNDRFVRFWWEVENKSILDIENQKWFTYAKGGDFKKWTGNLWTVVNWENKGKEIKNMVDSNGRQRSRPNNESFYLKEGITYTFSGSSASFRLLPKNSIFDVSGSSAFPVKYENINYSLAFLNSKIVNYILSCFNPTASTQVGDIKRIPFTIPDKIKENEIANLTKINIQISDKILGYSIIETVYKSSPLIYDSNSIISSIKKYLDTENYFNTQSEINEAIINEKIFEVYELTDADKAMVLAKEGESIGALPVSHAAKAAYLANEVAEFPLDTIREYIQNLPEQEFDSSTREAIENEFPQLYQSNNDLEEFCIRHQINPINVWYWFKESNIIPKQRMNDLAMEFLADLLREILLEDEDGIIPLVPNAGEKVLLDRIEEKFIEKGFSMAQYSSFDSVLGRELNDYINNHFFKNFSDHLNLFMYLPKTPFIWHLTSGPEQGFDCYIIIYKWNRDKLLSIRSRYIEQRERSLENRQSDLRAKSTLSASEQNELDKIYKQLKEIESFKQKIDELLVEGYNPVLDDGVGKNIAPLQKKKMIAYEVLNAGQLKKYLNADW